MKNHRNTARNRLNVNRLAAKRCFIVLKKASMSHLNAPKRVMLEADNGRVQMTYRLR